MSRVTHPIARAAAVLGVSAVLASCASVARNEVAAPPDGGTVEMRAGTPLVVSLPPDPSDGYGWTLRSASPNLALIGGPDYTPTPKPPGLVGVADTTTYRFRALAPGAGALEFAWTAPPGQPAPSPARTVRYDVNVTPPLPSSYRDLLGLSGKDGQSTVKY